MDINLAEERAFLLHPQLSFDQAEGRAWENKPKAFGRMAQISNFLSRPKESEFNLVYKEFRYQPFWHVVCHARYVYERDRTFELRTGSEVESVTIQGNNYKTPNNQVTIVGVEHCLEEPRQELFIDGITGEVSPLLTDYLKFPNRQVPQDQLDDISAEGPIFVPPEARASGIVRNILSNMIKGVQADRVIEESVTVERVDLYYRPVYAFQFQWIPKEKEAILEYDGMTAKIQTSGRIFQQYVGKMLDPDFLFDVGAETASMVVPGGGLALRIAKQSIEASRTQG